MAKTEEIVAAIRSTLLASFPDQMSYEGNRTRVGATAQRPWSGVCIEPAEFDRWNPDTPQAVHVTFELGYGNPHGKTRFNTRYPLNKLGVFNAAKLASRVADALNYIADDKARQAREIERHNEEVRQKDLLDPELKEAGIERWLYSIVRYEQDGRTYYKAKIEFPKLSLADLIELVRRSKS